MTGPRTRAASMDRRSNHSYSGWSPSGRLSSALSTLAQAYQQPKHLSMSRVLPCLES